MNLSGPKTVAPRATLAFLIAFTSCSSANTSASSTSDQSVTTTATNEQQVEAMKLSDMPAFADVPWADELKVEQDRFDNMGKPSSKYGEHTIPEFTGEFTNVVNTERVTLDLPCDGCPEKTLWWFGGSAGFGLGQRDEYTIASQLVRLAAASGIDLKVRNLAFPSAIHHDEVNHLKVHLDVDEDRPDLVVFYDGFNDALYTYMYAVVHHGELPTSNNFAGLSEQFLKLSPTPELDASTIDAVARSVSKRYRVASAEAAQLSVENNFDVQFFFQPDAFVSPLQSSGLAKSLNRTMAEISQKSDISRVLRTAADQLNGEVHNLRPLLVDFDKPVFADPGHMNETGAKIIADAIFMQIAPRLR